MQLRDGSASHSCRGTPNKRHRNDPHPGSYCEEQRSKDVSKSFPGESKHDIQPFNVCVVVHSCLALCNPMTVACQAPLSMGFSLGEFCMGLSMGFSARILQWGAIPFSRESFPPRDQTLVSCIAGRFFFFLPFELRGRPYSTLYAEKRGVICFKSSEKSIQSRSWPSDKLAQM